MRINTKDNIETCTFGELKAGTPFYECNALVKELYMKTENVNRETGVFINAVRVSDGSFLLLPEYGRVKIAMVHVENDEG